MQTEMVALVKLVPYPSNPKEHPQKQIDLIAGSIKEFGFLVPLVIDAENGIIAGHGRYLAAQKLELEEVPCISASDLTPTQIRAFRIADNKTSESPWSTDMLDLELEALDLDGFSLASIGFEDNNLEDKKDPKNAAQLPDNMVYSVVVDFRDEASQKAFLEEMEERGESCRLLIV